MPEDTDKPKFEVHHGQGEGTDEVRSAKAILGVIEGGGVESRPGGMNPRKTLKFNLAKIEDSGFQAEVEVFILHQAMVIAEEATSHLKEVPQPYVSSLFERAPKGMPKDLWAVILDDSLDELKKVYDFMDEEYFTRPRQDKLVSQLVYSHSTSPSRFWDDEVRRAMMIDSFRISYDLTTTSADELGMTPYDLLNSLQRELMREAGLESNPQSVEEAEESQDRLNILRRDAWQKLNQLRVEGSQTGA